MGLLDLPVELITRILTSVHWQTLVRCRCTSKVLRDMVDQTEALQYIIQLAAAGMEDGPPGRLSASDRLELLRRHQRAWGKLTWSEDYTIPMEAGNSFELLGNVLAQAIGDTALSCWQLPSKLRNIPLKEWKLMFDFRMRDFTMDPAQDLLVLVEAAPIGYSFRSRVHLRSLKSGERHPKARVTPIEVDVAGFSDRWAYSIKLSGQHLGILYKHRDELTERANHDKNQLVAWDWASGSELMTLISVGLQGFAFLDEDHLFTACCSRRKTKQATTTPCPPELFFHCFTSGTTPFKGNLVGQLVYPNIEDEGYRRITISVHSDPAPSWVPDDTLDVPFHQARGDRIFVISLNIMFYGMIRPIVHFVPLFVLREQLHRALQHRYPLRICWEDWGSKTFMTQQILLPDVWVCYVYGSRVLIVEEIIRRHSMGMGIRPELVLYDFNQQAYRRGLASKMSSSESTDDGSQNNTVKSEYTPNDEGEPSPERAEIEGDWEYFGSERAQEQNLQSTFANFTGTFLPFRRIKGDYSPPKDFGPLGNSTMLSEDSIIFMNLATRHGQRVNHILSF